MSAEGTGANRHLARFCEAEMRRLTGKLYSIDLEKLDAMELRELSRFLRDIAYEQQVVKNKARLTPWRR